MAEQRPAPKARLAEVLASLRRGSVRKVLAAVLLSVGSAFLVVENVQAPRGALRAGDVADRDIRAPISFSYADNSSTKERQAAAEQAVLPVFDLDTNLITRVRSRITSAFDMALQRYTEAMLTARAASKDDAPPEILSEISRDFVKLLEVSLDPADLKRVEDARWDRRIEVAARDLVGVALSGYVIADRAQLPSPEQPLTIVRLLQGSRDEVRLDSYKLIRTPEEARQAISLYALEQAPAHLDAEKLRAAVAIARAAVRPNLFYNQLITEERRLEARSRVAAVITHVPRGTALVRAGDVITERQGEMLAQLRAGYDAFSRWEAYLAVAALCGLAFATLYGFGATYIRRFTTQVRDVETLAFLVLLVLLFARIVQGVSEPLAQAAGGGLTSSSFAWLVPVAGGAMLVRVLANSETALLYLLPTSVLAGMVAGDGVQRVLTYAITGVVGVGGITHTRERLQVLKAGLQTGLVAALAALLLHMASSHLGTAPVASVQALWDVGLAICGGLLSAFMVLALVPLFEQAGYLTDYKLLELANLNHPLIRQLMLRAPGSYHHSIIVATLSEAAAEAIGGNALLARVSCYFHDVGKAFKPQYFIENQQGATNRHNRLEPRVSARIIVNHVLDGAAVARQYALPQPIIDSIFMHHGTGLIQYFYAKALERAGPGGVVDEAEFRYPGPRPNSRETGVIMLADKVEAACRTIKTPTPENLREMIQRLVNSTIEDGQFVDCPLTLREIYKIIDTFTHTLVGIYHQRIEYPGLPARPAATNPGETRASTVITLDMPNPFASKEGDTDPGDQGDWEAAER